MKHNSFIHILIVITFCAVFFTGGFFFGKSTSRQPVYVSIPETRPNTSVSDDAATDSPSDDSQRLVNLNTADFDELCSLPGIGEVLAEAIMDYRAEYGEFTVPSDIMNIDGIGIGTYESLKDRITV